MVLRCPPADRIKRSPVLPIRGDSFRSAQPSHEFCNLFRGHLSMGVYCAGLFQLLQYVKVQRSEGISCRVNKDSIRTLARDRPRANDDKVWMLGDLKGHSHSAAGTSKTQKCDGDLPRSHTLLNDCDVRTVRQPQRREPAYFARTKAAEPESSLHTPLPTRATTAPPSQANCTRPVSPSGGVNSTEAPPGRLTTTLCTLVSKLRASTATEEPSGAHVAGDSYSK